MGRQVVQGSRLAGGLVLIALVSGCGQGGQQGYLGQGSSWVDFVQWTQNGNSLAGSITSAELNGTSVTGNHAAFTGIVNGTQITLTFPGGFGSVTNWSGTLNGTALQLNVPQPDGTIAAIAFPPATVSDYNRAVQALQRQAAQQQAQQQAQQAAEQKAQQEADARNAVDQGIATVNSDLNSLSNDTGSFQGLSPSVNAHLTRGYDDTVATYQALQHVQSEGPGSLSCSVDASTVAVDASTVAVDESSVEVEQSSEQADVQSINGDMAKLDADFQNLQTAEGAIPSYQPTSAPTADQLAQSEHQARAAIAQADALIASALKQSKGWVDQANGYAKAAPGVCG